MGLLEKRQTVPALSGWGAFKMGFRTLSIQKAPQQEGLGCVTLFLLEVF